MIYSELPATVASQSLFLRPAILLQQLLLVLLLLLLLLLHTAYYVLLPLITTTTITNTKQALRLQPQPLLVANNYY